MRRARCSARSTRRVFASSRPAAPRGRGRSGAASARRTRTTRGTRAARSARRDPQTRDRRATRAESRRRAPRRRAARRTRARSAASGRAPRARSTSASPSFSHAGQTPTRRERRERCVRVLVRERRDEPRVDLRPAAHVDRAVPEARRAKAEALGERRVEDARVVHEHLHANARIDADRRRARARARTRASASTAISNAREPSGPE